MKWFHGLSVLGCFMWVGTGAAEDAPPPWSRTETRADCATFDPLRLPFFGDPHVHTSFSMDSYIRATRVTPTDAYAFAQGGTVLLADESGASTRPASLARPLDFAAVTDHAEYFGEVRECLSPGSPAFSDPLCEALREITDPDGMNANNTTFSSRLGFNPGHHGFCTDPGVDCEGAAELVWQETQAAAEAAYDRTEFCSFTSFIGYEHTPAPLGAHLHRNVIFRNENVPSPVVSYFETLQNGAPQALWSSLEDNCLDAGIGCDVLTIPHNSNFSGGIRWPDPSDAADAARRQAREPLVEIYQHKAASECRFDQLLGLGADTTDELCAFEQDPRSRQGPFPPPPLANFPRRNMVRNTLKDGLRFDQSLGVNPFRLGFVGGTDTHNGTPGATEEDNFSGHRGGADATGPRQLSGDPIGGSQVRFSPGGLAVVWAEENSRDALFEAMQRRETYATSGTRPVLRFFGGKLKGVRCHDPAFVADSYKTGAPMGSEIGAVRGRSSPRFAVLAAKDPGAAGSPGTDLQRVQIVKGWVDAQGDTHERVYEVAGDPANGAGVDPTSCEPVGPGSSELCAIWRDPDFDRNEHAFYYARAIENPTCRWSTRVCKSLGVDPLAADCEAQAAIAGDFENCCLDADNDSFAQPVIQERAWSSPIWYRPEAVAKLNARATLRGEPGTHRLRLALGIYRLPSGLDPSQAEFELTLRDDDEILTVALPAGSFIRKGPGQYRFRDASGTFGRGSQINLRIGPRDRGTLRVDLRGLDLQNADRVEHMIEVAMNLGSYTAEQTRLWEVRNESLRVKN